MLCVSSLDKHLSFFLSFFADVAGKSFVVVVVVVKLGNRNSVSWLLQRNVNINSGPNIRNHHFLKASST